MARTLGLDWGSSRIGIALSDEQGIMAFTPLAAIANDSQALKKIGKIVTEEKVGLIVLGMPINLSGGMGKSAESARKFGERVKKSCGVQIEYLDERFTTSQAKRKLSEVGIKRFQKGDLDNAAAQILLQEFLDSHKK